MNENEIGKVLVDAAVKVHRERLALAYARRFMRSWRVQDRVMACQEPVELLQQIILWRGGRADFVAPPLQTTAGMLPDGSQSIGTRTI